MTQETDWSAVADAAHREWVDSERQDKIEQLEAEIASLRAEADALRVDAMRYRWLRDTPWMNNHELARVIQMQKNALWDERIDAAMGVIA